MSVRDKAEKLDPPWWRDLHDKGKALAFLLSVIAVSAGVLSGYVIDRKLHESLPVKVSALEEGHRNLTHRLQRHEDLPAHDQVYLNAQAIHEFTAKLDTVRVAADHSRQVIGQILCHLEGLSQPQCLRRLNEIMGSRR